MYKLEYHGELRKLAKNAPNYNINDKFSALFSEGRKICIYGVGNSGKIVYRFLHEYENAKYNPVCFLDKNAEKIAGGGV